MIAVPALPTCTAGSGRGFGMTESASEAAVVANAGSGGAVTTGFAATRAAVRTSTRGEGSTEARAAAAGGVGEGALAAATSGDSRTSVAPSPVESSSRGAPLNRCDAAMSSSCVGCGMSRVLSLSYSPSSSAPFSGDSRTSVAPSAVDSSATSLLSSAALRGCVTSASAARSSVSPVPINVFDPARPTGGGADAVAVGAAEGGGGRRGGRARGGRLGLQARGGGRGRPLRRASPGAAQARRRAPSASPALPPQGGCFCADVPYAGVIDRAALASGGASATSFGFDSGAASGAARTTAVAAGFAAASAGFGVGAGENTACASSAGRSASLRAEAAGACAATGAGRARMGRGAAAFRCTRASSASSAETFCWTFTRRPAYRVPGSVTPLWEALDEAYSVSRYATRSSTSWLVRSSVLPCANWPFESPPQTP